MLTLVAKKTHFPIYTRETAWLIGSIICVYFTTLHWAISSVWAPPSHPKKPMLPAILFTLCFSHFLPFFPVANARSGQTTIRKQIQSLPSSPPAHIRHRHGSVLSRQRSAETANVNSALEEELEMTLGVGKHRQQRTEAAWTENSCVCVCEGRDKLSGFGGRKNWSYCCFNGVPEKKRW